MFVTTAGRFNTRLINEAIKAAGELGIPFQPRNGISIEKLMVKASSSSSMVVGKERIELYFKNKEYPFFFHPNSASFRIKRLLMGEKDPFIEAAGLTNGMSLLDCTMGLASDSIVASFIVGEKGRILAAEGNKYLHFIVKKGLQSWNSDLMEMNEAMKRIEPLHITYQELLKTLPENSVDVVYLDPMFEETITESKGIEGIRELALYGGLTNDVIMEAKRVAKKRIVLKDHFKSERFAELGFHVMKRKSSKFHFGYMDV
ncbi:class I SAM-dependent methyltransferase [Heyndrickxia acidicola]|uniref:Class I SAM-dependent methyltransferase n=1 Tax=Heyndrickxia acidicola TaxID=209389 RepID=A0ABU6MLH7_9BACI|nr:class I SAM-dependent methyltransferase [Heyndrickxia acidicola]MED1205370.1 class I SAM-dependent methyltransferase [Heyndrickxia acidicola]